MLKTEKQADHFENYVKCKTDDTRKVLFEIVYYLHKSSAEEDKGFYSKMIMPVLEELQ